MVTITHQHRTPQNIGHRITAFALVSFLALGAAVLVSVPDAHASGPTIRVSVATNGTQADDFTGLNVLNTDGRYTVFYSNSAALVPGDTNGLGDIFLHDRHTATTTRVSVGNGGVQGNGSSNSPSISGDGRYVAFTSFASNLISGDTNGLIDVFVRDRQTGTTSRVNVTSAGMQANNSGLNPHISRDGRYVAFVSRATNLAPADTNDRDDIFVHDRQTGVTTRVSVASDGTQANHDSAEPRISGDGRFVAFTSVATNLVANDTNNSKDVFVHDRQTGATTRVNVAGTTGAEAENPSSSSIPSISDDGRYIAFISNAKNLVSDDTNNVTDVFVHDRVMGTTVRANLGAGGAQASNQGESPSISGDGRFVAFASVAPNLIANDNNFASDIFVRDMQAGTTTLASLTNAGTQGNNTSSAPNISGDARFVAFNSFASNMVAGDTNGISDTFVHDRLGTLLSATITLQGRTSASPPNGHSLASVSLSDGSGGPAAADGTATFGVVDGTFTITGCAPGFLCAARQITINGGVVQGSLPPVQLFAGLVDGDTDVDINDVVAIISAFGSRPANRVDAQGRYVDLNGDGVVNLRDLSLALGNYGRTSATTWP